MTAKGSKPKAATPNNSATRARAPKGLGSISQRSDGRWVWQKDFGKDQITGKRNRPSRTSATREGALEAGLQVIREMQKAEESKGAPPPETPVCGNVLAGTPAPGTVGDWYSQWLRQVAARPNGSPNTYANYETQTRLRIVPSLGHIPMTQLTTSDVLAVLDDISSVSTRAMVHKTLARGWREAYDAEKVTDRDVVNRAPARRSSPVDGKPVARATTKSEVETKMLRLLATPPTTAIRSMPGDDIKKIFRAMEQDRMQARFVLGLVTGPRQSEALGLCWPWLEEPAKPGDPWVLNLHTTRVRDLYAHGCHEHAPCGLTPPKCPNRQYLDPIKPPKTKGSERQLYLGPGLVDFLLDWKGLQALELSNLADPPVVPWMFTTTAGLPVSHSTDAKAWQKILGRAKVSRHYTLHDLRRTAASEAAADPTVDKITLMGMFGWTRSSTADLYTRPQDARLKAAFRRQDGRFTDPGK